MNSDYFCALPVQLYSTVPVLYHHYCTVLTLIYPAITGTVL